MTLNDAIEEERALKRRDMEFANWQLETRLQIATDALRAVADDPNADGMFRHWATQVLARIEQGE